MTEFVGTLRTPRRDAAPATPAPGEVYYDQTANLLYWWDGTQWVAAVNQVFTGVSPPTPRGNYTLWIDTS